MYKTIILPAVLYGSGTWPPTLKVNRLRVLRRILRPRREEVTGGWRNCMMRGVLTSASCQILSDEQIEEDEMGGECGTMGKNEKCVQGFGGKSIRKETTWKDAGTDGKIIQ